MARDLRVGALTETNRPARDLVSLHNTCRRAGRALCREIPVLDTAGAGWEDDAP